jgi:hypothetical protein
LVGTIVRAENLSGPGVPQLRPPEPDAEGGPGLRLDETVGQLNSVYAPWVRCIAAYEGGNNLQSDETDYSQQAGAAAAQAACAHPKPLPPWQYDPAGDPPQLPGPCQPLVKARGELGFQARVHKGRKLGFDGVGEAD